MLISSTNNKDVSHRHYFERAIVSDFIRIGGRQKLLLGGVGRLNQKISRIMGESMRLEFNQCGPTPEATRYMPDGSQNLYVDTKDILSVII